MSMKRSSSHFLNNGESSSENTQADGNNKNISGASNSNENTISLPYHGSCPKCHHLHTNILFTIPNDLTKHSRFRCEACEHQIFGIGRTSTQTTLASIESIPQRHQQTRETTRLPNRQICVNASTVPENIESNPPDGPEEPPTPGLLTPIPETNPASGRSRSTSDLQRPGPTLPAGEAGRPCETKNGVSAPSSAGEDHIAPASELGKIRRAHRHKPSLRRLKSLFRSAVGKGKNLFGNHIGMTPVPGHSQPLHQRTAETGSSRDAVEPMATSTRTPNPRGLGSTATRKIVHTAPSALSLPQAPRLPRERVRGTVDSESDSKRRRIYHHRREKTLKSEAAQRPVCDCHPGCHCMRGDHSLENESKDMSISRVPDYALDLPIAPPSRNSTSSTSSGRLFPPSHHALLGIGNHFPSSERGSTPGSSSSELHLNEMSANNTICGSNDSSAYLAGGRTPGAQTSSSSRREVNRLSQSTATGSVNDSSTSLPNGRPQGVQTSGRAIYYRSRTRAVIHNHDALLPTPGNHGEIQMTESPLRSQIPNNQTTTNSDDDDQRISGTVPLDAIATRISLISRQDSEPVTTTQTQEPGHISSYIESTNGEFEHSSQDRTPRPRSHHEPIGEPDISTSPEPGHLRVALQNIGPDDSPTDTVIIERH